jgi:hypothetical protein
MSTPQSGCGPAQITVLYNQDTGNVAMELVFDERTYVVELDRDEATAIRDAFTDAIEKVQQVHKARH